MLSLIFIGGTPPTSSVVGGTWNAHSFFPTGQADVVLTLYDPLTSNAVPTDSDACVEYGSTGLYVWDLSKVTTLPASYKEYGYVMTDGATSSGGTVVYDPLFIEQYIVHKEMLG